MPQTAKMIDVSRSYIPIDPNTYAANLALSRYQDAPDQASPIVAYDGKNFIPTISGYKSYFGIDRAVQTDSLPSRADHVISFQNAAYQNILVAMCEDGIYIKHGADYGAWVKKVSVETSGGQYKEWSYCVLADAIYCYRTNDLQYYCIPSKVASANLEFYPMAPYMHIQVEAGYQYNPLAVGTYSFKVMGQLKAGWVTALSAASAELTITTPSSILLWINEANVTKYSDKYAFIRFYITKGAVTKYIDVVATSADTAQVRLTATAWDSAQVVTEVPDEDMLSRPFTAGQPVIGITPSFLNMVGQLGIFSAGTRLGFWDSEDSVSWSSMDDYTDFTPSLTTLAGSAIFSDVTGRIVTIQQLGDGFVIYSTQSIVYVAKEEGQLLLWSPKQLAKIGLSYRKQVTPSYYKHEHYAWTGDGLMRVAAGQVELIVPEVLDLMKKHNSPVYPELIDGRYLCLQIMDKDFELRKVLNTEITIEGGVLEFPPLDTIEHIQDAIEANVSPEVFCQLNQTLLETQFQASSNVIYNPGQHIPIYDWKLAVCNARADKVWENAQQSSGGFDTVFTTTDLGAPVQSSEGAGKEFKIKPRALALTGLNSGPAFPPEHLIGSYIRPRNKVSDFLQIQTELWKRSDANSAEMLTELYDKTVKLRTTYKHVVTHLDLPTQATAALSAQMTSANILGTYSVLNKMADMLVVDEEINQNSWIAMQYGTPEIDISECSVNLRRRCKMVGELWARRKAPAELTTAQNNVAVTFIGNGAMASPGVYEWFTGPSFAAVMIQIEAAHPADNITWVYHESTATYEGKWGGYPQFLIKPYGVGTFSAYRDSTYTAFLKNLKLGKFHIETASMYLTGWYNITTGAVTQSNACSIPIRTALGEGTNQIPDVLDPATGKSCGSAMFNSTYYVLDWVNGVGNPLEWTPYVPSLVQLPDYEFVLQEGSPAPAYPTFYGAYVYDLFLKKWGKLDQEYSLLLNYSAINGQNGQPVSFNAFQMNSGILDTYGAIRLFDDKPSESFIRYGKIGYDRKGFTAAEEVRVGFSSPSTCTVALEPSITGVSIEKNLKDSVSVVSANGATLFANLSARWYNVTISGKYDINYLEFRGHSSGRR